MFANDTVKQKYEKRLKDYTDTVCMRKPENIVIGVNHHTSQIAWAKTNVQKCVYDAEHYVNACVPFYGEYPLDLLTIPLVNPLEAIWILGRDTFFVSNDGVTVQYRENVPMKEDDYDALIADPIAFMTDVLFPRKFPHLMEEPEMSYNLLRAAAEAFLRFRASMGRYNSEAKDRYGILAYNGGKVYVPFDVLMDRIRGISDTLVDMRRQPQKVIDACEALMPIYLKPMAGLHVPEQHGFCTLHAPTFLNKKQFEKFFWPGLKEMIMYAHDKGSLTWVQFQGACEHILEYFKDVPKGSVILNLEKEDPIEVRKQMGDHVIIESGVPLTWYRSRTRQECMDLAKKIIDECAASGAFIYGIGSGGLSEGDLCPETMPAVLKFVHEYK